MSSNLPPGCSVRDIPGNGPEICGCCGATNLNKCICPECPKCGAVGDSICYEEHGLCYTHAQLKGVERMFRESAEQRHQELEFENKALRRSEENLAAALRMTLAWIDAVPKDTQLPAMPGFDRDWVNGVLSDSNAI